MAEAWGSGTRPMRAPSSCATARRTRTDGSAGSSRRTRGWASCDTRTPDTRKRSASRKTTTSECRPSSERMTERSHPAVTVDGLVLVDGKLVAIRRRNDPFRGMPALPSGFVELGGTTVEAVVREVREETGLETRVKRLVGVFSDPNRDPRGHVISIVYELEATGGRLKAGSDAAAIERVNLSAVPVMAFDHNEIVRVWRGL